MKKIILLLILILIVGCVANPVQQQSKFKTIMVKTVGEVETLPNMASFTINLTCIKKTVKQSKECLVDKANALQKQLLDFGIAKDDLLTTAINMHKSYTWSNNSRIFQGYRSNTTLQVKVRDMDKLETIYTSLLETENLNLSGLNYNHSDIDGLKNQAYVNALKKANVLADALLVELDESNKEILKVGNVQITASLPNNQPPRTAVVEEAEMIRDEMSVQNKSIPINNGTIRITATLYVEYQID